MLKITEKIQIPLTEFDFSFARSGGPGGQNVNKVNSKATLSWDIGKTESIPVSVKERFRTKYRRRINKDGILLISSQRFRDQGRNVADCLSKLQDLVRSVEPAPRKRKSTRPSKGSIERRLNEKRKNSAKKQDRRSISQDD